MAQTSNELPANGAQAAGKQKRFHGSDLWDRDHMKDPNAPRRQCAECGAWLTVDVHGRVLMHTLDRNVHGSGDICPGSKTPPLIKGLKPRMDR